KWFFPLIYKNLSISDDLETSRSKIREAMKEIKYGRYALPGAVELLEHLKKREFILGVISNNDGRTNEKCEEVGIGKYFDIIVDSTNLGLVKPDSSIFRFVLNRLNIEASQAIHIGDLFGSDVMGGLNAGLDVIWVNHRQIQKPDDKPVVEVKRLSEVKTHITN
ncbi:MAG: HAD family hydrolase, partial [Thermodesulfobacteriota bacterium]